MDSLAPILDMKVGGGCGVWGEEEPRGGRWRRLSGSGPCAERGTECDVPRLPCWATQVANLAGEEIPQIYAACGRGSRSTLRVLRPGLAVTGKRAAHGVGLACRCRSRPPGGVSSLAGEHPALAAPLPARLPAHLPWPAPRAEMAVSPLPGNPTAVWTIKRSVGDEFDAYIVVSFSNATLVLRCGAWAGACCCRCVPSCSAPAVLGCPPSPAGTPSPPPPLLPAPPAAASARLWRR